MDEEFRLCADPLRHLEPVELFHTPACKFFLKSTSVKLSG